MKPGTFNFWIDPENSPNAFDLGIRCHWAVFAIEGEKCVVYSDGPTLAATLRMDSENPVPLFRVAFSPSLTNRHVVTIGWRKGRIRVYLDANPIAEVVFPQIVPQRRNSN